MIFRLQSHGVHVPAMNEWGVVLLMVLAGIWSLCYLRGKKL